MNMKKRILALVFMVVCFVINMLSLFGIERMYESKVFIPVYVGSQFILANRIVRLAIYILLAVVVIITFFGTVYYFDKLTAKTKRRRRKNNK